MSLSPAVCMSCAWDGSVSKHALARFTHGVRAGKGKAGDFQPWRDVALLDGGGMGIGG
jgi:hypothetical protein